MTRTTRIDSFPDQTPGDVLNGVAPHPFGWTPDSPAMVPELATFLADREEWFASEDPAVAYFLGGDGGSYYRAEAVA